MSKDKNPFHQKSTSFPKLRRAFERFRTAFSLRTNLSFDSSATDESEDDRFAYPLSRLNFEETDDGSERERISHDTTTSPEATGNAQLVAESPFSGPFLEELPSFVREGRLSFEISPRHSIESGQTTSHPSSSSSALQRTIRRDESVSSWQPFFSPNHKPSISKRLADLRPQGCNGLLDTPTTIADEQSNPQLSVDIRDRLAATEKLPPSYSIHLLQHDHVPAIEESDFNEGPMSDEEYVYYKNFAGTWVANEAHSDDVQSILDILGMPSADKDDVHKDEWMKLFIDRHHVQFCCNARGLQMINERRPWTGGRVPNGRRDNRHGGAECWVERYAQGLVFRTRWTGAHAKDIYEYLELTSDFMHMVTRQDVFAVSDKICQRRIVWDRRLT